MTALLPTPLLSKFSGFISEEMGLYFPPEKWVDLERGIQAASKAFKFNNVQSCIHWLMSAPLNNKQIETLAGYLTIGESYFFRDNKVFDILEKTLLPPIIYKRYLGDKQLRIWSAGCSSGEEPYSLAIVINKLIPDIKNWHIALLATDINTMALKKLSKGIYSEWSFRDVPEDLKRSNFKKTADGNYELLSGIKKMVEPLYLNLSKDNYPSLLTNTNAMDIIFCRNVLMYFSPQLIKKVIKKFFDCLVDDGYLIVGSSDGINEYYSDFKRELIGGFTIYQKKSKVAYDQVTTLPELIVMPENIDENLQVEKIETEDKGEKIEQDYQSLMLECANQGKLKEALDWSKKALLKNKTNLEFHYLQALILLELGNSTEAITALKRVLYLNKDFILAYVVLGNIFRLRKEKVTAEKYFGQALSLLKNTHDGKELGDLSPERLIEIIASMKELE